MEIDVETARVLVLKRKCKGARERKKKEVMLSTSESKTGTFKSLSFPGSLKEIPQQRLSSSGSMGDNLHVGDFISNYSIRGTISFQKYSNEAKTDRVTSLLGQPSAFFQHFSGYIRIQVEEVEKSFFYWFFEAETNPTTKPLVLWLNRGLGCSSVGTRCVIIYYYAYHHAIISDELYEILREYDFTQPIGTSKYQRCFEEFDDLSRLNIDLYNSFTPTYSKEAPSKYQWNWRGYQADTILV